MLLHSPRWLFPTTRSCLPHSGHAHLLSLHASPHPHHPSQHLSTARQGPDLSSGFTGSHDPSLESGRGPMFNKPTFGVPHFYPRDLKRRVDEYVVGQERAKKTICSTLFNHYQTLRRSHQHEHDERNMQELLSRRRLARDRELLPKRRETSSSEDGYSTHYESIRPLHEDRALDEDYMNRPYITDDRSSPGHVKINKSNLLLIGPTGVGKTYILEILSKKIQAPFSICDCNSLTQAGYVGQDVETCIERLLVEANYDVKATESGIIVLDEFDKLARRDSPTGRDVGGEGVQQALLKLVEGTRITVSVKDNRLSRSSPPITTSYGHVPGSSSSSTQSAASGNKVDHYTVDTTNILFVFCGAFVGLDKAILRRVAQPSMGFGGELKSPSSLSGTRHSLPLEMYAHLAHYDTVSASSFTPLDLATPTDLQLFGFIPELIGRLHNICSLSPLSQEDLFRILTEPRNNLVAQYTALFETYPSRLFFTEKALQAIAARAVAHGTGARGLKMEMERVLAEPMFDAPTPYVLITEGCVMGTEKAAYWGKDGRFELDRRLEEEEIVRPSNSSPLTFERLREAGQSGG